MSILWSSFCADFVCVFLLFIIGYEAYNSVKPFQSHNIIDTNHYAPQFDAMGFESSSLSLKSEYFTDL